MAKKILIAFDESENSQRAVDFVGAHFAGDCSVTLFNVLLDTEAMCAMESPELTPYFKSEQSAFCSLEDKKKEVVNQAMERGRRCLIECGFSPDRVETKAKVREKGLPGISSRRSRMANTIWWCSASRDYPDSRNFSWAACPRKLFMAQKTPLSCWLNDISLGESI